MAGIFFGIITRQAIRRGSFTSVKDLITAIETHIDGWNERCQPFTWTNTADEIIPKPTGGQRPGRVRGPHGFRADATPGGGGDVSTRVRALQGSF